MHREMPNRLFVISGCAQSGLEQSARVFTALGAPCGHEKVFEPRAFTAGGTLFWPPKVVGDASWFAAPVLGKLPDTTVVLHQVRGPLETISDLYASRFFEVDSTPRQFVQDFLPETKLGGPLVACMRYWQQWNRMVETVDDYEDLIYRRHRIEDFPAARLVETTALLGLARNASSAERVLAELRPDESGGEGAAPKAAQLSWDDLPDSRLRDQVRELANRYGYVA